MKKDTVDLRTLLIFEKSPDFLGLEEKFDSDRFLLEVKSLICHVPEYYAISDSEKTFLLQMHDRPQLIAATTDTVWVAFTMAEPHDESMAEKIELLSDFMQSKGKPVWMLESGSVRCYVALSGTVDSVVKGLTQTPFGGGFNPLSHNDNRAQDLQSALIKEISKNKSLRESIKG